MFVDNHRDAGRLFIDLALGNVQIPGDTAGRKQLLRDNGVNADDYQDIVFHEDTEETLNLIVRRGDLIQKRIDKLKEDNGEYTLPDDLDVIYREYFTLPDNFKGSSPTKKAKRRELFDNRIGDYTFSFCM